jgi:hypothetical protein
MSVNRFYELFQQNYLGGVSDFYTFYERVMEEMGASE